MNKNPTDFFLLSENSSNNWPAVVLRLKYLATGTGVSGGLHPGLDNSSLGNTIS